MSEYNLASQQGQMDWYSGPTAYSAEPQYGPPGGARVHQAYHADSFEDEPPLLEELGIDIPGILKKTRAILMLRVSAPALEDLDMGGPLMFAALLGGLHLLMGKLHFGVILGWSVVASAVLFFVVNQLAGHGNPDSQSLVLYNCCCLMGYCLIPTVLLSAFALLVPGRGILHLVCAGLCVVWSTHIASALFIRRSPCLVDLRTLVAYPCFLVYSIFAMLSLY
eukprot:evm.model.scf_1534.2 EVM.evm.TU.scf_1534.2   scf_1534:5625-7995(+)